MIAVIDYGVGNLFSLCSSLKFIGEDAKITADVNEIKSADKLILPGVGAFADAKKKLDDTGLSDLIKEEVKRGKEILGICLGMQLLFEESHEFGVHEGLGLLKGKVVAMEGKIPDKLKIPHIGWNSLHLVKDNPLLKYVNEGDFVYFVHSYFAKDCQESIIAETTYGIPMTAAASFENVSGCQFHPEKSGKTGLSILKAFCEKEALK